MHMLAIAGAMLVAMAGLAADEIGPPLRIKWELGPPMPQYRKGGVLGAVGGRIVYAGGMQHPWKEPEDVLAYDPQTGAWETIAPLPVGPSYTCGTSADGALYLVGGRHSEGRCFRLTRDGEDWVWTELPALEQPRVFASVAVVGGKLMAAGGGWGMKFGAFDPTPVTDVVALDLARPEGGWHTMSHYPGPDRPNAMGASCAGKFWMFGGHWSAEQGMNLPDGTRVTHLCPRMSDAFCYDPEIAEWARIADLPRGLAGAFAVAYADRYVIMAGGSHISHWSSEFEFEGETVGGYSDEVLVYDTRLDRYHLLPERMPAGVGDIRACLVGDKLYCAGGENIDKRTSNTINLLQIGTIEALGG